METLKRAANQIKLTTKYNQATADKNNGQVQLFGKYEVEKLLGAGSFGKVYLAKNVTTSERVAIKVVDKEEVVKNGLISQIKREISIHGKVRHPNIVQLFEVMATKSKIYIVMEYVSGGELFFKVQKGRLKEEVARKYFQQLISAVSFFHERGVFHRDLKLENLLLDEQDNIKVLDFGLCTVSDQLRQDGLSHTLCGTPAYVAPEILSRKRYNAAKVDIWSSGVILFTMTAGYLPFFNQSHILMYRKICKGEYPRPSWFSPELIKLISRLLDTNPGTRITMPEIMENKWFRKGFKRIKFYVEDDGVYHLHDNNKHVQEVVAWSCSEPPRSKLESEFDTSTKASTPPLPRPPSLNAFDIISLSPSLSLSGLFEDGGDGERFVTKAPASRIISKLEEIAYFSKFTMRRKGCGIKLEGSREGVNGPLTIIAEIFELTSELGMIEVKKQSGDKSEYEEFFNKELKPGLMKLMQEEPEPEHGLSVSPVSCSGSFVASRLHGPLRATSLPAQMSPLTLESTNALFHPLLPC